MLKRLLLILMLTVLSATPAFAGDRDIVLKDPIPEHPPAIVTLSPPISTGHGAKSKWKCLGYFSCGTHHPITYQGWRKTRRAAIRSKPYVDYAGSLGQVTYSVAQWFIK